MKKKISAFIILLLTVIVLCTCLRSGMFSNFTIEGIKNYIMSFGVLGPVVYIIMFTIVPLTLFPDSVLAVTGGLVFGIWWGTLYTIIGAASGGTLAFFISRLCGRKTVEKLIKHKAEWFQDGVEKRGFLIVFVLRLIPLVPFDIISYGAGLSKIKYRDFVSATIAGIIPGVLVFTNLGDKSLNIWSIEFLCAVCVLLLLCAISYVLKKKFTIEKIQSDVNSEKADQQTL